MPKQENKPPTFKSGQFFKVALAVCLILGMILTGIIIMNLDNLRKPIMDELSQMTGLSIEIESLSLSLSNGLSLRGGGLKVNSKDGSKEIFSAKDIFLNAELRPLLKRQLKIKKINLVKPIMNIAWEPKSDSVDLTDISVAEKTLDRELPPQPDKTKVSELPVTPRSKTYLMESIRKLLKRQDLSLRTVEIKDATLIIVQPRSNGVLCPSTYLCI